MPMTTRGKGQGRPQMTRPSPLPALVRKPKASKKKKATKVVASKALTTVVQKILNRQDETKYVVNALYSAQASSNLGTFTAFTSAITSSSEAYNCIPQVAQGTDDYQRVGNQIQPVSLVVKGTVSLLPTNLNSEAVYADIYFLTCKNVKDQRDQAQLPITTLLNYGNGTNGQYDGTSFISASPINKTQFTQLRHLRIKLVKVKGDPNAALTGTATADASVSPATYSNTFSVKITLPKKLTYEAAGDVWPTNSYPFMVAGFHGVDTTGDTAPINPRIRIQAQAQMYYKDA